MFVAVMHVGGVLVLVLGCVVVMRMRVGADYGWVV